MSKKEMIQYIKRCDYLDLVVDMLKNEKNRELLNDFDVIKTIVEKYGSRFNKNILQYAGDEILNDKEFLLKIIKTDFDAIVEMINNITIDGLVDNLELK